MWSLLAAQLPLTYFKTLAYQGWRSWKSSTASQHWGQLAHSVELFWMLFKGLEASDYVCGSGSSANVCLLRCTHVEQAGFAFDL